METRFPPKHGAPAVMILLLTLAAAGAPAQILMPPPGSEQLPAGPSPRTTPLVNPAAGTLAPGVAMTRTRQLTLNDAHDPPITVNGMAYPGGPRIILVNNTMWDGMFGRSPGAEAPGPDFTAAMRNGVTSYLPQMPKEGDTEIWEIINMTSSALQVHLSLTRFQVLNRQAYDARGYAAQYTEAFPAGIYAPRSGPPLDYGTGGARTFGGNPDVAPFLKGPIQPPAGSEAEWTDTVTAPPGMVTRIVVRWTSTMVPVNAPASQLSYVLAPRGVPAPRAASGGRLF